MTFNPLKLVGEFLFWWGNRRSALSTIRIVSALGVWPQTLVDLGANNSQWAKYLHRHWPEMVIHSYEPNPKCQPLGIVHRVAVGNIPCRVSFNACDKQGHVNDSGQAEVDVVRFEDAPVALIRPAILKVDCENFTEAALRGCGERLRDFQFVHVEMMNDLPDPQFLNRQVEINQLLLDAGFTHCECVDAALWPSSVHYYDLLYYRKAAA